MTIKPYVPSDKRDWKVGEQCTVMMNFRTPGFNGGWSLFHYAAVILKVNRRTVRVCRVGWWGEDRLVGKEMVY